MVILISFHSLKALPIRQVVSITQTTNDYEDDYMPALSPSGQDNFSFIVGLSSFLGGNGEERDPLLFVDTKGNIIVAGYTDSDDFPVFNPFDNSNGGGYEGFVAGISSSGSLLFSSYFGGSLSEFPSALIVDDQGNIIVTGYTRSEDFPIVNAFDTVYGDQEGFIIGVST